MSSLNIQILTVKCRCHKDLKYIPTDFSEGNVPTCKQDFFFLQSVEIENKSLYSAIVTIPAGHKKTYNGLKTFSKLCGQV